jgi:hypothetical protein
MARLRWLALIGFLLFISLGCEAWVPGDRGGGNGDGGDSADTPPDDRELIPLTFADSDEDFLNPERGYYAGMNLLSPGGALELRDRGHTLAIAQVQLDEYRFGDIDSQLLATIDAGFDGVRAAGIKVILRFKYNSAQTDDAPKETMLRHIEQLAPILEANSDVIAVLQAGFIGAWGEWHGSTFGLDNDEDRGDILMALLDALPASRSVQVRRPVFKERLIGGPVSDARAFDGSPMARVGHHNDCFLASDSDYGTYDAPVDEWHQWTASDTRFTPMGGETCALYEPRTNCAASLEVMASHHWSYLNSQYNVAVLDGWEEGGCGGDVRRGLGYRLSLQRVAHSQSVAPGGLLALEIDLVNRGFAAMYNERPVYIVLTGGGERHTARLDGADPRRWQPGTAISLATRLRLPADLEPGSYAVSLWLPDADPSLAADTRYSVRLASDGVWSAETGENVLVHDLLVDPSAPGHIDPSASSLREI